MYSAKFELEAITPIFMKGVNQAEIRSPSIKGLMRWWFRALAGNYFGNDVHSLKKAEDSFFGSTGRRSRIEVNVKCDQKPKKAIFTFKGKKPIFDRYSHIHELSYLWFSVKMLASKGQIETYYPPKTKFEIQIRCYDRKSFDIALTTLWTLITLGGIGFRNRRGTGCLSFSSGDLHHFKDMGLKLNSTADLRNSIRNAIEIVGDILNLKPLSNPKVSYPVLSEKTSYVGILNSGNNPINLLKEFQRRYLNFRRRNKLVSRITFGLPIVKHNIRGTLGNAIKRERRASPMLLGVTKVGNGFCLRVVKFKTEPYHPNPLINSKAEWRILKNFNETLNEIDVFGSLEVFK